MIKEKICCRHEIMKKIKFLFDLDGTLTQEETLPILAEHFGIEDKISALTEYAVKGQVPFVDSFIERVSYLGQFPVEEVAVLLKDVPLYERVVSFIHAHPTSCAIVTGNVGAWVARLVQRIGVEVFASKAQIQEGKIAHLSDILAKETVVYRFQEAGYRVVFIGDGNNDFEAMQAADFSIAAGLTHEPATSLLAIADEIVYQEKALVELLEALYLGHEIKVN